MSETTINLSTSGMHCSSCAMLIDMTLNDLEGVIESRTDHATGQTVVRYDTDRLTVDEIVRAIQGVGYEAEPVG